jgi:flagellin-like hook-associated protein FlgL
MNENTLALKAIARKLRQVRRALSDARSWLNTAEAIEDEACASLAVLQAEASLADVRQTLNEAFGARRVLACF